jgi:NAD-dependent protein deacetylase/lipoamidase
MGRLIIFSGAGLSAESGLATFRNAPGSLWEEYDLNQVCNYLNWQRNYNLVHRFYNMRRSQLGMVEPNAAHRQIAAWQKTYETVVLTQNVDDLLERAGCVDVIHLHGFLPEMTCEACRRVWNIGYGQWQVDDLCPHNDEHPAWRKTVKPNVVFFNQEAPRYRDLSGILSSLEPPDVVVVVGTSEAVVPIGEYLRDRPGFKIFNALEASRSGVYDESLIMPATQAFPLIDQIIRMLMA